MKTNQEEIKQMSNKTLGKFIEILVTSQESCDSCPLMTADGNCKKNNISKRCHEALADWLLSPSEIYETYPLSDI